MLPNATPGEVIDTHLGAARLPGDSHQPSVDLTFARMREDEHLHSHTAAPALLRPVNPTMLDKNYRYSPYVCHDVKNEAQNQYNPSATLRTYLEVSELSRTGRLDLKTACTDASCVGLSWPGTKPVRGFDIMDMIEPNGLTDALMTQMFMVQFGRDRDVLMISANFMRE